MKSETKTHRPSFFIGSSCTFVFSVHCGRLFGCCGAVRRVSSWHVCVSVLFLTCAQARSFSMSDTDRFDGRALTLFAPRRWKQNQLKECRAWSLYRSKRGKDRDKKGGKTGCKRQLAGTVSAGCSVYHACTYAKERGA